MHHRYAPVTKRITLGRLLWAAGASLGITLATLPTATGALASAQTPQARTDETTISQNALRTGWDANEPQMSPAQVKRFRQLWTRHLTGQVYAQPLVLGSTVVVATENDYVYGLDAATGAIKWTTKVGTPYAITSCNDLAPDVGVTGGPVYDPGTGDVYVMAQIKPSKTPLYSLFGIDPANGKITESIGVPLHPSNASSLTFSGTNQMARPGLLADGGWVYAAFGSHCDHKPYVGYVAGFNVSTKARTLWADETGSANDQAGIWQSGGGLMSDGAGRIYFTSGNGISPAAGPGTKPPHQLAESVVRLGRNSAGTLSAKDFFSPDNAPKLDSADTDWGSGSPMGLPLGTASYPHVLSQVGKDGRIFLLNRDNLGGRNSSNNNAALSVTKSYNGEWGHPAAFADTATLSAGNAAAAHDYFYYIGKKDNLRILKFGVNGADKPTLSQIANSTVSFGYSSGSPAVTSNGTDPASAVVWAVYTAGTTGSNGTLEAFPATPSAAGWPSGCTSGCTVSPLGSWNIGTASKFTNIATANGHVYVGTRTGTVYAFSGPTTYIGGVSAPTPPHTQSVFTPTPVSGATTTSVTLTAARTMTVTGVSASTGAVGSPPPPGTTAPAQFTVNTGQASSATTHVAAPSPRGVAAPSPVGTATPAPAISAVRFPVTLNKGDKLTVPVTFTPSSPGGATGTVTFATSAGPQTLPVAGIGTTAGLYTNQKSVQFALVNDIGQFESNVPVGIQVPREFNIVNGSTKPVTISSVSAPGSPYSVASGPKPGDVLQPGESQVVQIQFAPTTPGNYPATYSITGSDGTTASAQLTGAGLPPTGLFKATPRKINFGSVRVGKRKTRVITLTNIGNEPATVVSTSTLVGPFTRTIRLTPQLDINAGYDVRAPISFTPRHKGTFTTHYTFTWSDVTGTHHLTITITGRGTAPAHPARSHPTRHS